MNRLDVFLQDTQKYFDYFFETKGFTSQITPNPLNEEALQATKLIRGFGPGPTIVERKPALIIQGIMPRSGTVYAGELMRLHPDLYAYPYQLWEFPALMLTGDILNLQKRFLLNYKKNIGKLGEEDFLPIFGAAMIGYLHASTPIEKRVLIKMPAVQYLSHFFSMFPYENLLILTRDGRDLVHSTLRTWPRLNFPQVCLRWNRSARVILSTVDAFKAKQQTGYWLGRYEEALVDPISFVQKACDHLNLDKERYPYQKIDEVRVIGSSKLAANKGTVDWQVHQEKPKDFKPTQYWQSWSPLKKLTFKVIAGRSLIKLRYETDMDW
ncbi:sulfotransferase [Anaerolineales bacterium HSG25]|nr:sulfotransferase [Anaerolineales bacterium HSG25]